MTPIVQVWPDRYCLAWTGDPEQLRLTEGGPPEHSQVRLDVAMLSHYETDAHVVPYALRFRRGPMLRYAPRVRKAALQALGQLDVVVQLGCAPVDVDAPIDVRSRGEDAVAEWYDGQVGALADLSIPSRYRYRTRGGYRLVWELDGMVGPKEYEALSHALRRQIVHATRGVVSPDEACSDWTRCYRLPLVVRDGEGQCHPVIEDDTAAPLPTEDLIHEGRLLVRCEGTGPRPILDRVGEGGRNDLLVTVGGKLRRAGLSAEEIMAALRKVNDDRCDPPMEEDKVREISTWTENLDAPPIVAPSADRVRFEIGSEVEVTRHVLQRLEGTGPGLVRDRGTLWRYDASVGTWAEVTRAEAAQVTMMLDGSLIGGGKEARYLRVGSPTCAHVYELAGLSRDRPGWFDAHALGLAMSNGVVLLDDDGEPRLVPSSPDHHLLHRLEVAWDPGATCPTFYSLLARAFRDCPDAADRTTLLAEFVGACLYGLATRYQRALLLVGDGANGKSTILDVASALFPPHARRAIPPQLLGDQYYRAELAGALINIVTEVPESDIVAGAAFRSLVDGSPITARRIYQPPFEFTPQVGHLWACNTLPGVRDFTHAFWRRWLAIEFPNVIPEEEQEGGLSARIVASELPGVARWAVAGAASLVRRGRYAPPPSSTEARDRWRREADQVALFADERLEDDPEGRVPSQRVYDAYRMWARANGHNSPLSSKKFCARLLRLGFCRAQRTSRNRTWKLRVLAQKTYTLQV